MYIYSLSWWAQHLFFCAHRWHRSSIIDHLLTTLFSVPSFHQPTCLVLGHSFSHCRCHGSIKGVLLSRKRTMSQCPTVKQTILKNLGLCKCNHSSDNKRLRLFCILQGLVWRDHTISLGPAYRSKVFSPHLLLISWLLSSCLLTSCLACCFMRLLRLLHECTWLHSTGLVSAAVQSIIG